VLHFCNVFIYVLPIFPLGVHLPPSSLPSFMSFLYVAWLSAIPPFSLNIFPFPSFSRLPPLDTTTQTAVRYVSYHIPPLLCGFRFPLSLILIFSAFFDPIHPIRCSFSGSFFFPYRAALSSPRVVFQIPFFLRTGFCQIFRQTSLLNSPFISRFFE